MDFTLSNSESYNILKLDEVFLQIDSFQKNGTSDFLVPPVLITSCSPQNLCWI